MVMHVRRTLSKKEQKEYEEWKARHDAEIKKNALSKRELEKKRTAFWESQAALVKSKLEARGGYRSAPSLPPQPSTEPKKAPEIEMDPEEYARREAAARAEIEAKKSRVGPTYNKGGAQYWSDGMLADLKGGGHRRR